jgi:hypothetical protein
MTLSLQPKSEEFEPLGRWPLPLRPPFMRGDIYDALRRDIASYVIEEISGRSYLIAGHRGSGKTAVTMTVVKDLRRDLLIGSVQVDPDAEPTIRRLQRPLLVKLHGPSLMETSSAAVDGTKPAKPAAPAAAEEPADRHLPDARPSEPKGGEAKAAEPTKPPPVAVEAHTALKQITIGLYRALAAETALGARAHAEEREANLGPRGVELAAQLALDLDAGVEPAALRAYWERLGRLQLGVLWPRLADDLLHERGMLDQGLREIMALATAAQAYRVCSGAVVYSRSEKLNHSGSDEIKQSQSWDAKTLVSLVGALGAGALAGAAVLTHAPWTSIGAGALVWLAGSLAVTWTAARKQERQQAADYSFIRDSSLQTLDRELPLMIQRIRDAGLAPIFVIDELDKLGDPDETIAQIIARLKHIIVDYGFFCFLTDRDYYDHIKSKLREGAFPVEHTFFSELRLVSYRPRELADYIRSLLVAGRPTGTR